MYTDAHIHLVDIARLCGSEITLQPNSIICASSSDIEEFQWSERFALTNSTKVFLSCGIHPQNPRESLIQCIEELAREKRIAAIGECGFDFFTPQYKATKESQKAVWEAQLAIALRYQLPIIVHCRKALDCIFSYSNTLQLLPAVVFHGWGASVVEALSLRKRGINAFFSIGKGLLRGDASLIDCAKKLPIEYLLSETDAPWMLLRGQSCSLPSDITHVVSQICTIRKMLPQDVEKALLQNFMTVFANQQ